MQHYMYIWNKNAQKVDQCHFENAYIVFVHFRLNFLFFYLDVEQITKTMKFYLADSFYYAIILMYMYAIVSKVVDRKVCNSWKYPQGQ